jgi:predicted nucleotidyltransferase
MNRTQKILIAVGVGVGLAYVYRRYMMPKKQMQTGVSEKDMASMPTATANDPQTRSEKEEYILDNAMASESETMSGMEGTKFVWNPQLGRFYPVGTIIEGKEPAYYDSVFYGADGNLKTNVPNAVKNAETTLKDMTDQELELAYQIVKFCKENPDSRGDMNKVIKGMNISNPRIIEVINKKISKKLNDIKIAKKDASWNEKWQMRKEKRLKMRKDFFDKTGLDKDAFEMARNKVCGKLKSNARYTADKMAKYEGCSEMVAKKMRERAKIKVRESVNNAPVDVKSEITDVRQNQFAQQVTKRTTGGMFAGERWDGKDNTYTETLVSEGLV